MDFHKVKAHDGSRRGEETGLGNQKFFVSYFYTATAYVGILTWVRYDRREFGSAKPTKGLYKKVEKKRLKAEFVQ